MQVIAITGSIATGKSYIAEIFAKYDIPVFNSDIATDELLKNDKKTFCDIKKNFPTVIENGLIDRVKLAKIVFSDDEKLRILEEIIHKKIFAMRAEFIKKCQREGKKAVICDIPLLFEKKLEKDFDVIIVVYSNEDMQKKQALMRKNMTEDKFNAIISKQMPAKEKIKRADYVVFNDYIPENVKKNIDNILQELNINKN